ncbi:hypothetical protein, variant [Sphaeroforma arctica JP610]|nr:hypothetical protein, variant [Sphaeroforma arctica JP610]KNC84046.1 hypothetical protein, variant [Sphaeroforma arctica JP610]|eukprot:XP_014157948.1 hypothetical protein, variant [Sphaeroforma arctica JP610]
MSQPVIVQKLTEDLVFGSLPHTGKQTVGDICCGVGHHSVLFALQGFHVTGIDINAIAIQRAQKNKLKAQAAIEAAGGSLAFICGNVLEDRDISATVGKFNILIDSAAYHCFSPVKKSSYVRFLTSLSHMGTRLLFLNLR